MSGPRSSSFASRCPDPHHHRRLHLSWPRVRRRGADRDRRSAAARRARSSASQAARSSLPRRRTPLADARRPPPTARHAHAAPPTPVAARRRSRPRCWRAGTIAGPSCRGQFDVLPAPRGQRSPRSFASPTPAPATRSASRSTGPGGTIAGGPYTLQGGGDGYYYSTLHASASCRRASTPWSPPATATRSPRPRSSAAAEPQPPPEDSLTRAEVRDAVPPAARRRAARALMRLEHAAMRRRRRHLGVVERRRDLDDVHRRQLDRR